MEALLFKLRNFANGLGLYFFVSMENSLGDVEIEFVRNEDNKILQYTIQKHDVGDEVYVQIVTAVVQTFVGVVEEEPVIEPVKVCEESVRTVDICGLSKNEYIALELTKAWASTRCNGHEGLDEISDVYFNFIKLLEDY